MLSLSRKVGQKIMIGTDVVLTVTEVRGGKVRLEFDAPIEVLILREEIVGAPTREEREGRAPGRRLSSPADKTWGGVG